MMSIRAFVACAGLFTLIGSCRIASVMAQAPLPRLELVSVQRVFHNGEHNAFTDLVRFQDHYYLTFRSCPQGHGVHPTSSILVLRSADLRQWQEVFRFSVPKRDTRDPHFLVFRNRLFVYTGTWYCGRGSPKQLEMNRHLGYAVWTQDGRKWHGPRMLEGTYGHYIWRAATYGGKAYLCGRRKREFAEGPTGGGYARLVQSVMLESEDGLVWRTRSFFQQQDGDETAFLFHPDGSVLAVARRGRGPAQLCRSRLPWNHWQRKDLDRYIGGPLLVRWGKHYLVGGRNRTEQGYRTVLAWLHQDRLHTALVLPSGGDNSYPGFVALSETEAVVSYYSSHQRDAQGRTITAIYLARIRKQPGSPAKP